MCRDEDNILSVLNWSIPDNDGHPQIRIIFFIKFKVTTVPLRVLYCILVVYLQFLYMYCYNPSLPIL